MRASHVLSLPDRKSNKTQCTYYQNERSKLFVLRLMGILCKHTFHKLDTLYILIHTFMDVFWPDCELVETLSICLREDME